MEGADFITDTDIADDKKADGEPRKKWSSISALLKRPPKPLPKASALRNLFMDLQRADLASASDRSLILNQLTGALPFDPAALQDAGRGDATNVNFGAGEDQMNNIVAGYANLVGSEEVMAKPAFKPWVARDYKPEQLRRFEDSLARRFSWLNTERWENFFHYRMRLTRNFCFDGLGFVVFENDLDWRWCPYSLEDVKFPRRQKMSLTGFGKIVIQKWITGPELLELMGDDMDLAEEAGWNVEAVFGSLPLLGTQPEYSQTYNPEFWIRQIKDNDFVYRGGDAAKLQIFMGLMRNMDGSVGFYICGAQPPVCGPSASEDDFLFCNPRMFRSPTQFVVPFAYDIGTGDTDSIRGAGYRIFQKDLASNRALCLLVDNALNSSGAMWRAKTQTAVENFAAYRFGPSTVVGPDFEFIPQDVPNLGQNVLPVIAQMNMLKQNAVGPTIRGTDDVGQERTATESKIAASADAELNAAERTNFFTSWKYVLNSQWDRLTRRELSAKDPGGADAMEMRKRIKKDGVPDEVFYDGVDYWIPSRPMGNGSAALEAVKLDKLLQMVTLLPAEGRAEALRWVLASIVGWDRVEGFLPSVPDAPDMEGQLAALENGIFAVADPKVLPGQNAATHLKMHAPETLRLMQELGQEMAAGMPPDGAKLQALANSVDHGKAHIEVMAQTPQPPQELQQYAQIYAQAENYVKQLGKEMERMQAEQQKAMEEQAQAQQAQGDPQAAMDAQIKQQMAQQQMEIAQRKADQQFQNSQRKADQQLENAKIKLAVGVEHKDTMGAADIRRRDAQAAVEAARTGGEAQPAGAMMPPVPEIDPVRRLTAVAGAFKNGIPVTYPEMNLALIGAGLPPLEVGKEIERPKEPAAAGSG